MTTYKGRAKMNHPMKAMRSLWYFVTGGGADFIHKRRSFIDLRRRMETEVIEQAHSEPSPFRENTCPVCGLRSISKTFKNPVGFSFSVCASDGTVFMDPVLTEDTLEKLYNNPAYEVRWNEGSGSNRASKTGDSDLKALCRMLGEPSTRLRLLDVGCASGHFLSDASSRFDVEGVELSSKAAKVAREKGFVVHQGYVNDLPGSELYDVVTFIQLIEHVVDPNETLQSVWRLLKPGGVFYVSTPASDSMSFSYLERLHRHVAGFAHVSIYGKEALVRLIEQHGFECLLHEHWGNEDLALHDVVSLALAKDSYFQGMALFSPRLYHASNFLDSALFGIPGKLALPKGNRPYQRAAFRKTG